MRITGLRWAVVLSVLLAGCAGSERSGTAAHSPAKGSRVLLTVDFEADQTLRYKFVSEKKIMIDWDPNAPAGPGKLAQQNGRLEMVIAYTPTLVDPYGATTVRATCERVEAVRSTRNVGRDAATTAQGKSFELKVDPRGRLLDDSSLRSLLSEMGNAAFVNEPRLGRTKNPDMIGDFVASQWFLWDAESSLPHPAAGVTQGKSWKSKLSVPAPMVMRKARDVTYRLDGWRDTANGRCAVIASTYRLADSVPTSWPIPYSGRFRMSETFGFLGNYRVLSLDGSGQELFNVDAGRIEQSEQKYVMTIRASALMMGLSTEPRITIEQTLSMELQ